MALTRTAVRIASVAALVASVLARDASATPKMIAVLPLDVTHAKGKLDADAVASLEEMLRDVAANTLTSSGWTILTGETTIQVLKDNGVEPDKCGDQACHLSMAREIKADKFLSGTIQFVDGEFTASIRLIDTTSGRILASAEAIGKTATSLREVFENKANEFFARAGLIAASEAPPRPVSSEPIAPPPPPPEPTRPTPPTYVAPPKPSEAATLAPSPGGHVDQRSGLEFLAIPAGTFHLGCEPQDHDCDHDEKDGSTQVVAAFWMGRIPVTVSAYDRCVNAGGCKPIESGRGCNTGVAGKENHPVNCVDWNQAQAFCTWIGGRLPTAVEWEYAAKGGESRIYPWGDGPPTPNLARFRSDETVPAGSLPEGASKFGLLDMSGNVAQWTSTKKRRDWEVRGSGYGRRESALRNSKRNNESADDRDKERGFRCRL